MIKRILFCLLLLLSFCCQAADIPADAPQKAIIAGRVLHFDPANPSIRIYVNRLLGETEEIPVPLDHEGRFRTEIETYTPADLRIRGRLAFQAVVLPGDSLHVVFDGSTRDPEKLLGQAEFSGDEAGFNRDIVRFQLLYQPIWKDWQKQDSALYYDVEPFLQFLDTLEGRRKAIFDRFITEVKPGKEARLWVELFLREAYYENYLTYPGRHRAYTRRSASEWDVPDGYYDSFKKEFHRIDEAMFINTKATTDLARYYFKFAIIAPLLIAHPEIQHMSLEEQRSLVFTGIIERVQDPVLRELLLADMFWQELEMYMVANYEKNKGPAERYIVSPWLRNPLQEKYAEVKHKIDNPQINPGAVIHDVSGLSASEILEHVRTKNPEKVVYVDFWASWCSPCLAEMPKSKMLMSEMESRDAAFVFIAVDDQKQPWNVALAELQLPGQHYLLDKKQSREMREILGMRSIPFYLLIDKKGEMKDKGGASHMRPGGVKPMLEGFLKE